MGNLPIPPKKDANDQVIISTDPLDLDYYTHEQAIVITVNAKAKNLLYNAISGEKYDKVPSCETAKEMWDKLEITFEGTNKLKETRINLLVHDYELFQMKDGELVKEIFSRFSKILGDLKSFSRPIKSEEQVRKILRSLPTIWQPKVIALECQDLDKMSYDELRENEEEEEGGERDENIAMLSQVVASMMRKNRYSRRGKSNFRKGRTNNENDKNDGRCYECRKHGHIQADCPVLKKKLNRNLQKKKFFGAWSDEEESDHEEIANMCFMAIKEDSNEDSGELGLMKDKGVDEEEGSGELGLMEDEGTNESPNSMEEHLPLETNKKNVIGVGKVPLSSTCDVHKVYLIDELGYNLLSISKLCDNDYEVHFKKHDWFIEDKSGKVILSGNRNMNAYTISNVDSLGNQICLASVIDDPWVWHRKLEHASMYTIQKLSKHDLVIGLPKLDFSKDHICDECQL
ncbi:uncharacterized protein LOC142179243 [Nicotiana tabacum]|uniref:Uncharacterized protein LOC142179243 n=2 Tax=Nicotiana tabacum TaxID=4097 RepID=A0AC58U6G7_TOBAC